jgi:hypothetical protein
MSSLDKSDRKASATVAMRSLATHEPVRAVNVSDHFGLGRDDGSLEHRVQVWAPENMAQATRWIRSQPPDDPKTAQSRSQIELIRAQQQEAAP